MKYFSFGRRLPGWLSIPLFGDRERFGLQIQPDDPCWKEWYGNRLDIYRNTQKGLLTDKVNHSGYRVIEKIRLDGLRILEIGIGWEIKHIKYWRGLPGKYVVADISRKMLESCASQLSKMEVDYSVELLAHEYSVLPFENDEFDMIFSFYNLEHLYPLATYLGEMVRVLKPGGKLVGAVPCEGGMMWGTGRFFTSRRWLKKNLSLNPDKVMCWEHPNFADTIMDTLESTMNREYVSFWPFGLPLIDFNLVSRFIYEKRSTREQSREEK